MRDYRPRRSCLAVPGSSEKMLLKAQTLPVDQVFLDLEDSVAPSLKVASRATVVEALNAGDWGSKVTAVRVNDASTKWAFDDVITVVRGAGANLDCIMLPKVEHVAHIHWLDTLLTQLEMDLGLPIGKIGIEAQVEGPSGWVDLDAIAGSSPRIETLIFGPGDFTAAMRIPGQVIGAVPESGHFDPFAAILTTIVAVARKHGIQAIDGPYGVIRDVEGYRRAAERGRIAGFDGKWVLHPGQIDVANELFKPSQKEYDEAEYILDAYEYYTSAAGGGLGAVMLGEQMIDEASRKIAIGTAEAGRRIAMERTTHFEPPK